MTARQFRLDAAIRMFGFWVKWVPANGATPGFAYTVGLSEKGRRDLLITGLPLKTSIDLLSDLAYLEQDGRALPGVAQVAMQQGEHAAANVVRMLSKESLQPFRYRDKGAMATVGRNAAVARLGGRIYTGFPAWLVWLAVHIFFLIGFRNRLGVLLNWAWNYLFYERAVRLILPNNDTRPPLEDRAHKR